MFITQGLHRGVIHHPERIATIFGDRKLTYRELRDRIAGVAGMLRALGVERGDRVTIMALNSDTYMQFYFAVIWAGAIVNPANTRWSRAEIVYSLNDCTAKVMVVDENFRAMAEGIKADVPSIEKVVYIGSGEPAEGMLKFDDELAKAEAIPDEFLGHDVPAAIFYTGGTTGFPKGVLLSHTNMLTSALSRLAIGLPTGPRYLHTAPMFHLTATLGILWQSLSGGTHVIVPAFDALKVIQIIEKEKVTDTLLVPTMLQMIVQHPDVAKYDLSSWKSLVYGGSPISETTLDAALRLFPNLSFIQGYGMTELGGSCCYLPPYYHTPEGRKENKLGSAGKSSVFTEIKIIGADGEELERGKVGEIAIRGSQTMIEYWGKKQETAAVLRNGWLHTGDGAYMDGEGYIYIVDRIKDMIVSGGENIYSAEVENAIAKHPSVAACAVIGIPSEKWGESVHAVVILRPGLTAVEQEIVDHCKTLIAAYKCPRSVEFRDALPLTGAGKVQKGALRAPHWADQTRQVG